MMTRAIQALIIRRDKYTAEQAKELIRELGLTPIKGVHLTDNYRRFRIREPSDFRADSLRTLKIKGHRGTKVIVGELLDA